MNGTPGNFSSLSNPPLSSIFTSSHPCASRTMLEGANLPPGLHSSLWRQSLIASPPACLPPWTTMGGQNDGKFCRPAHHRLPPLIFKLCRMVQTAALHWRFWNANCKSLLCSLFYEQTCSRFTRLFVVVCRHHAQNTTLWCFRPCKPYIFWKL